jgi:hypothetical protein
MPVSTLARPQPPSIDDPAPNEYQGWEAGKDDDSPGMEADAEGGYGDQPDWAKRARDAYQFSTSYIDSNYRKQWDDSIRAFNNQHSSDSKYNSDAFRKRSRLYRPKTRSVIRKNEAASAAAFFSNMDLLSIQPQNSAVKAEVVSAEVMQQLLQYRLTKTIPWFLVVQGGIQDAQVQGVPVAHVHWRYTTITNEQGETETIEDKPVIDLIPVENIRIDPAAHWMDPINSSPYVIHLIPMYVCDVKEKMERADPKGRRWNYMPDNVLMAASAPDDSTRSARLGVAQDPTQQRRSISDYDVVWVHRHIHRWRGIDWEFYTLNSERMLTDPEPLSNTVFHGKRPYVMGMAILETHKPMPASVPTLAEGLQQETNEIANQRLDNIKLILNKRWLAKRGKNVDLPSLLRNVPGAVTLLDDMEDVKEVNWNDVTPSAYQEQGRIDADMDDLVGNFSASSAQLSANAREPARKLELLQNPANTLTEYLLKTYTETFITQILRQLVMLEQHYETDDVILAIAGQRAQVLQKYGVDDVTDAILDKELTVTVNVGMGATDPVMKLQKFTFALGQIAGLMAKPVPGLDVKEAAKEIFGLSGYQDGERFFDKDPNQAKAQAQIAQLTQLVKQLTMDKKIKVDANPTRLQIARERNATTLAGLELKNKHENVHLFASHLMDLEKMGVDGQQKAQQAAQTGQDEAQQGGQPQSPAANAQTLEEAAA